MNCMRRSRAGWGWGCFGFGLRLNHVFGDAVNIRKCFVVQSIVGYPDVICVQPTSSDAKSN